MPFTPSLSFTPRPPFDCLIVRSSFACLIVASLLNLVGLNMAHAASHSPAANASTTSDAQASSDAPFNPDTHAAPDKFVQQISERTLDVLKNDRRIKTLNMKRVYQVVSQHILPYVDFEKTTRLAAGALWKQATPDQQIRLTHAFRQTLIRTYSGALGDVDQDTSLKVLPLANPQTKQAGAPQPSKTPQDVIVYSLLNQSNRDPIQISYRLENTPQGWKIYDLIIENLSLIVSYREQFHQQVSQNKMQSKQNRENEIDGLITALNRKNAQ